MIEGVKKCELYLVIVTGFLHSGNRVKSLCQIGDDIGCKKMRAISDYCDWFLTKRETLIDSNKIRRKTKLILHGRLRRILLNKANPSRSPKATVLDQPFSKRLSFGSTFS